MKTGEVKNFKKLIILFTKDANESNFLASSSSWLWLQNHRDSMVASVTLSLSSIKTGIKKYVTVRERLTVRKSLVHDYIKISSMVKY